MAEADVGEVRRLLAAPFDPKDLKWKPQTARGDRALAVCYVDARAVMDRLDDVLGPGGWSDDYEVLERGDQVKVKCTLRARIGGEWVTRVDVGGESEQPDEGDRCKAAFSDALKRAAVKLGVGRYLYRLPAQWVGYDPKTRRLTGLPQLPGWAVPTGGQQQQKQKTPKKRQQPAAAAPSPASVEERARAFEARLAERGLCEEGDLLAWLVEMCGPAWSRAPEADVEEACREFREVVGREAVERGEGRPEAVEAAAAAAGAD